MNNINELYNLWLEKATADPDLKKELLGVKGNDDEVLDRFYRSLEFGTAGLRGVIGAGTNRMNYYTVGRATQGLADFLNKHFENPSIAIGYDSRIKSEYFSVEAAKTLAANGIKVYLYEELEPTPCLSFAIRHFKTSSGIILTASHNPAKYNGYKCYNENGYQMTDEEASETYDFIQKVDYFTGIKTMDFDEAKEKGIAVKVGKFIMSANGKSLITKEERGFIKIVAEEESGVIVGAQMMCARATDMIGEFVTAVANNMTVSQLLKGMRAHPTYNEGIGEALEELEGGAIHVMPKKKK